MHLIPRVIFMPIVPSLSGRTHTPVFSGSAPPQPRTGRGPDDDLFQFPQVGKNVIPLPSSRIG